MKKILIITIVIALAVMLTFPAILFAEEGDANSTVGVREQSGQAGQYVLGDRDGTYPDGKVEVLGLTKLASTGISMVIPISGVSIMLSGIGMLLWSFLSRRKNWKHIWRRK